MCSSAYSAASTSNRPGTRFATTSLVANPDHIGRAHYDAAHAVRELLHRQRDLREGAPEGKFREYTTEERLRIARAHKAQQFFSQPFAVATPFTGRPGQIIPLEEDSSGV